MNLVAFQGLGEANADNFRSIVLYPRYRLGDRHHPCGNELACGFQYREPPAAVRRTDMVLTGAIAAADLLKDPTVPPKDRPYRFRAAHTHRRDLLPSGFFEKQLPRILTVQSQAQLVATWLRFCRKRKPSISDGLEAEPRGCGLLRLRWLKHQSVSQQRRGIKEPLAAAQPRGPNPWNQHDLQTPPERTTFRTIARTTSGSWVIPLIKRPSLKGLPQIFPIASKPCTLAPTPPTG